MFTYYHEVQWHSPQGNFTRDTPAINQYDKLEKHFPIISFKSSRGKWVNCCYMRVIFTHILQNYLIDNVTAIVLKPVKLPHWLIWANISHWFLLIYDMTTTKQSMTNVFLMGHVVCVRWDGSQQAVLETWEVVIINSLVVSLCLSSRLSVLTGHLFWMGMSPPLSQRQIQLLFSVWCKQTLSDKCNTCNSLWWNRIEF